MTAPRPGDVVTTREQWDALPVGTVVEDAEGDQTTKRSNEMWCWTRINSTPYPNSRRSQCPVLITSEWPVTVVSVPEPTPAEQDAQVPDEAISAMAQVLFGGGLGLVLNEAEHRELLRRIPIAITAAAPFMWAQGERDFPDDYGWNDLVALLDAHWPEDIFPTLPDRESRDLGPRIVSLLRWVDRLQQGEREHRASALEDAIRDSPTQTGYWVVASGAQVRGIREQWLRERAAAEREGGAL